MAYSLELDSDVALRLIRLLEPLAGRQVLAYGRGQPLAYDGPRIPEASDLLDDLLTTIHPGFDIGDRVVWRRDPTGDVGTIIGMTLFDYGWQLAVGFDEEGLCHPYADDLWRASE